MSDEKTEIPKSLGEREVKEAYNIVYKNRGQIKAKSLWGGFFTKNALECSDLWSEMKSAKVSISHVSWGFFHEA